MSREEHTPGPWSLSFSRDGSGDIGIKADGPVNIHAEVFAEFWARGDFRHEEAIANARLIAAAPALLEALRPFAEAARDADDEADLDRMSAWETAMAMAVTVGDFRRALAAISQATASPPAPLTTSPSGSGSQRGGGE